MLLAPAFCFCPGGDSPWETNIGGQDVQFGQAQMAKDFALQFYASGAWKKARSAYRKQAGGMCERCLVQPGEIVHHKKALTPQNISDPRIALGFDNLELVCRDCHAAAHGRAKRYKVDEFGRVAISQTSPHSGSRGGY